MYKNFLSRLKLEKQKMERKGYILNNTQKVARLECHQENPEYYPGNDNFSLKNKCGKHRRLFYKGSWYFEIQDICFS